MLVKYEVVIAVRNSIGEYHSGEFYTMLLPQAVRSDADWLELTKGLKSANVYFDITESETEYDTVTNFFNNNPDIKEFVVSCKRLA